MTTAGPARAVLAAASATVLTGVALSTLVQGVTWFAETLLVVGAVTAVGAAVRRAGAPRPLVPVAQTLAVLVLLTWLFAAGQAWAGLVPGPAALARLVDLGGGGVALTREVAAPAPGLPAIRVLVVAGMGAVAVLVDTAAVTYRQPALAGLPLLAVYAVPAALLPQGLPWYWFALAAAGFLLLVASDSGDRVARWGRVLSGQGGQQAPLAATGRRVGALALGVALLVPALVPGLAEGLYLGPGSGDGDGDGTIRIGNPIVDLRDDLVADSDEPLIRYETEVDRPDPLRIVTVDTFDGDRWRPTTGSVPRSQEASGELPPPPGLTEATPAAERRTRVEVVGDLRETYLPVPYPPVRVDLLGPWLYEAESLNIVGDGVTTREGMGYDVRYLDVVPEPEDLLAAPFPPREVLDRWTRLPNEVPPSVAATAARVAGDGPDYAQATALQEWFRSAGGFRYTTNAPDAHGSSAIAEFLRTREGFCVQFASSMAVMARSLGIPARVAVGFLPGDQQPDGSWLITVRDAHAWPELYFSGAGWVRFEPTPATRTGTLPSWALAPASAGATEPTAAATAPVAEPDDRSAAAAEGAVDTPEPTLRERLAAVPWRAVAALAVVLGVGLAPLVATAAVRRRRWRRAGTPVARAEVAWAQLAEATGDLALAWPASCTPRQAEERLAAQLDRGAEGGRSAGSPERQALHRLARAVERARYATVPDEGGRLRDDVRTVVRGLRQGVPAGRRARARWLPPSGSEHLRSTFVDLGLAVDRAERRVARWMGTPVRRLRGTG